MKQAATISFAFFMLLSAVLLQSCARNASPDRREKEKPQSANLQSMLENEYAEGRLLVRFKDQSVGQAEVHPAEKKLDEWGVRIKHAYHGELTGLYSVEGDFLVCDLLPVVLSDPTVKYAEPVYRINSAYQPNDPGAQSWTVDGYHLNKIHAFEAWDTTKGDSSFVIGFVDSGCTLTHEDITDNLWINAAEAGGAPGVDDDGNGYVDDINGWDFINGDNSLDDWDNHGTVTSSAAVAVGDNGKGIAGVAYQSKVAVLKGNQFTEAAAEAFQYAVDKGFRVVNASWGSVYSQAIYDAITEMDNNGMLLVCVAGNQGRDLATFSIYPACYPHDNIIVVMNTDMYDFKRDSSNWGLAEVDLGAPGTDLYLAQNWGGYGYSTGTSYSTPVVSGACALLWSKYPYLTHMQVKQLVNDNVDVLSSLTGTCVTGGRLNVKKALDAAGTLIPAPEADFEADITVGIADLTVTFTDMSSGCPTSWSWDFGDGDTSTQQNPQHTYTTAGTFSVTLTVSRDDDSDTQIKANYIEVLAPGSVIAEFSGTPTSGFLPLTVFFTDQSQGSVTGLLWSFGDGTTSSEQNPSHTYNSLGTYAVSLTVSGAAADDTEMKFDYINVIPLPPKKKSGAGGSCAIRHSLEPDNLVDVIGCFIPILVLAGVFTLMKLCKGKGARG